MTISRHQTETDVIDTLDISENEMGFSDDPEQSERIEISIDEKIRCLLEDIKRYNSDKSLPLCEYLTAYRILNFLQK